MTKWNPRVLSAQERAHAGLFVAHSRADLALLARYTEFLRLNALTGAAVEFGLACAAAQWRTDGLAGTTIVSYCFRLLRVLPRLSAGGYAEAKRVIRNIEYSCRHDTIHRAPEIASGDLSHLLASLDNPFHRLATEMIYKTAMRLGDLNDVVPGEILLCGNTVTIQLVGGKNHRRFCDRDLLVTQLSDFACEMLRAIKAAGVPRIMCVSTQELSDAITQALGRKATSYSIRNLRILELISSERNADGIVNWDAVRAVTRHRSTAALRSAYQFPGKKTM
jgi:hypothetical protein